MLGKIYKIIHNDSDICYVGSTITTLARRWSQHKAKYKKDAHFSIYPYFKEHGLENFTIIEIKEYEVVDIKHLRAYEQLWINKLNPVNKKGAFRMLDDILKKAENKKYREANRDKINKQKCEKVLCECGLQTTRSHSARHRKTQRHLNNFTLLNVF